MLSEAASRYVELCDEIALRPLSDLVAMLCREPNVVNVSNIYLPRKHFPCLLALIRERSDIQVVNFDETTLSEDDVEALAKTLKGSNVHSLSLRNVPLSMKGSEALMSLCESNCSITEINVTGSLALGCIQDRIRLLVEMNQLRSDINSSACQPGIHSEAPPKNRMVLEMLPESASCNLGVGVRAQSAKATLDAFMESGSIYFSDDHFSIDKCGLNGDIRWFRVSELCTNVSDSSILWKGSSPFSPSELLGNQKLLACIYVLQQHDFLKKNTVKIALPDIGFYSFRFFVKGEPVEVFIDDRLPFYYDGGVRKFVGVGCNPNDFWGALLEKAFAKFIGGYDLICKATFGEILTILTGGTCFDIDWVAMKSIKSSELYQVLRYFHSRKLVLVTQAIPRNDIARKALLERGITPEQPYTLIGTNVCRSNGEHVAYAVQLTAPCSNISCRDSFTHDRFYESELNGFSVFWMRIEYFATLFEHTTLLMWPYDDPLAQHRKIVTLDAVTAADGNSSLFARNYAIGLENLSSTECTVMIALTRTESERGTNAFTQVHFFKLPRSDEPLCTSKRYDTCPQNQLFSTCIVKGTEWAIIFRLLPNERLQLTVAGSPGTTCKVETSSIGTFRMLPLKDTMQSYSCQGEWGFRIGNVRTPIALYSFLNKSEETIDSIIVAVAQEKTTLPPFAISVVGWQNVSHESTEIPMSPHFLSEQLRETLAVFKLSVCVLPKQRLFILPCCHDDCCPPHFNFSVYSKQSLVEEHVSM